MKIRPQRNNKIRLGPQTKAMGIKGLGYKNTQYGSGMDRKNGSRNLYMTSYLKAGTGLKMSDYKN